MNKIIKRSLLLALALFICCLGFYLFRVFKYTHHFNRDVYKSYMWIFKDSIKNDVDTRFCYSYTQKKDIYNGFSYKQYGIILWEFKDLQNIDLNKIIIIKHADLNDIQFTPGEILNKGSGLEIQIKNKLALNNNISIVFDKYSEINETNSSSSYIGLHGLINKMALYDEFNKPQILFEFEKDFASALVILYKGHNSFYLIIFINTSKELVDDEVVNILNLR